MAITIRHDAAAVGLQPSKQKQRFGQELVLQQQRSELLNKQRLQDQWYDQQRIRQANAFQLQRDRRMEAADDKRLKLGFANQKALFQERDAAENRQWQQRRELELADLDAREERNRFEMQVQGARAGLSQADLTPEGTSKAKELLGELKAIEAQRGNLRPEAYREKVSEWMDKVDNAGMDNYKRPAPTLDEDLEANFKDLGTGYGVFRTFDNNGKPKWQVLEIDPTKTKGAGAASDTVSQNLADVPFEQFVQDPKNADSLYDEGMKFAEKKMQEAAGDNAPARPSDDDIKAGMRQAYALQQQRSRVQGSFMPPPAQPAQPQQAPPVQPQQAAPAQPEELPVPPQAKPQVPPATMPNPVVTQPPAQPVPQQVTPEPMPRLSKRPVADESQPVLPQSEYTSAAVDLTDSQKEYASVEDWMKDPEVISGFKEAVAAGQYQPGQERQYTIDLLNHLGTHYAGDNKGGKGKVDGQKAASELYQTAPKVKTEEEALALDQREFLAPDGTYRYRAR